MIDFHTHILPGVDDGSKNLSESLQMLQMESRQGVQLVMLTPHYYSSQYSPQSFLQRRQQAWEMLKEAWEEGMPQLLLGAEVQYFEGITNLEGLNRLCIQGTRLLLLEMPFCKWEERVLRAVLELNETQDIQVVLAHVDRYLSFPGNTKALDRLRQHGILMQMNISCFEGWFSARKAAAMVKKGYVHFYGSDCHNTGGRKPNWDLVPQNLRHIMKASGRKLLWQYINK